MIGDEGNRDHLQLSLSSRARVAVTMMFIHSLYTHLICFYYMSRIALNLLSDMSGVLLVVIQQNQTDIKIIHLWPYIWTYQWCS